MTFRLRPVTKAEAQSFIAKHHRHNRPPRIDIFRVGAELDGELVGVAWAETPNARALQDGYTVEVTRLCTDGTSNACSFLYGACRRAAKALGYTRVVTYTLASEPGSSLRASGFVAVATLPERTSHSCRARHRVVVDLFGDEARPTGPKVRWEWSNRHEV